jgi:hypothetical protein
MLASRSTPRTIAAIALAACVACAVILWLAIRSPRGPEAVAVAAADRDPAAAPPASAPPDIEVAADTPAPRVDGTHAGEPVLPKIADLHLEAGTFRYHDVAPVTGQLVLRAVDRDTGVPLRSFSVRLASETRFAAESNVEPAEELALVLTPDTYAVLVASPGYEPVELARSPSQPARRSAPIRSRCRPAPAASPYRRRAPNSSTGSRSNCAGPAAGPARAAPSPRRATRAKGPEPAAPLVAARRTTRSSGSDPTGARNSRASRPASSHSASSTRAGERSATSAASISPRPKRPR